jgi:hypothetical protein
MRTTDTRPARVVPVAVATVTVLLGVASLARSSRTFRFDMVPSSAAIQTCLPGASGSVTLKNTKVNQIMTVKVTGLAPNTGYDLFVTQVPHAPFGVSWYQSDLETDARGNGEATVRGIFNEETFSISPDSVTTFGRENATQTSPAFGAVNQYHLGLWFNDPQVPFDLGCEPTASAPVVTPFNGEQHAGIQVLNTSNFADSDGPLRHF